jgi:rod shape-determining protein MreB
LGTCFGLLGSERDLFIGSLAAEAASGFLIVTLGAQQFKTIDADNRLAPLFTAIAVGPAIQLDAADYAQQRAFFHVISGHLGLLAPDLKVEPVRLVVAAAAVHGHGEVGNHAARFEVAHFGIAAGTADEGDGIHAHWILLLVLVSMMRHGFCGCFQGVPPLPPDVTGRVEFHPYDSPACGPMAVLFRRFQLSRDIGIDLGTANTLIYVSGKGIVLQEPSVVALDLERGSTLAVGDEAKLMLGRTPGNIRAVRPLRDGVIADFDAAEQMLKTFITKGNEGRGIMAPRLVVGIPSGVTGVERRAVREAGMAGAREVHLIDEPVAAAIGAGLPVTEPVGTMIVDIGGGTTEVAVLSLGGTVLSESVRVAGDEISDAIGVYLKKVHNMVVGERTAEDIKIRIGSAFPDDSFDQESMDVRGLHLLSGLPRTINLKAGDLREAIAEPLNVIVEAVKRTLERTPPELAADIVDRGIMLAGGGALVRGISDLISHETGIFVHIAEDPLLCVVNGCGQVLEDWKRLQRVVDTPEFIRSPAGA